MTDETEARGMRGGTGQPAATFVNEVFKAQAQAMSQAQSWSLDAMTAYREQAEAYNSLLQALNRTLAAAERSQRALVELAESHAKAAQALTDGVSASRELVSTAEASNRKSLERLETLVTGMVEQAAAQVAALGSQTLPESFTAGPLAAQNAAYQELTRTWAQAFTSMLGSGGAPEQEPGSGKSH